MESPLKVVVACNLETLNNLKKSLIEQFNALMSNEDVDLVERWNFFIENSKAILPVGKWCGNFPKPVKAYLEEHRYLERYYTYFYEDIYEELSYGSTVDDADWIKDVNVWVNDNRDLVRSIITSGISGSTWDW